MLKGFIDFSRILISELKFSLEFVLISNFVEESLFSDLGVRCLVKSFVLVSLSFSKNLFFMGLQYYFYTISLTFFLFLPTFLSSFLNLSSLIRIYVAISDLIFLQL